LTDKPLHLGELHLGQFHLGFIARTKNPLRQKTGQQR
jgi:hypothetical protein